MEDSFGLTTLIKQRRQRPSYTRVISWELSHPAENIPVDRKKKSKKSSRESSEGGSNANVDLCEGELEEGHDDPFVDDSLCCGTDDAESVGSCHGDGNFTSSSDDDLYYSAEEILDDASSGESENAHILSSNKGENATRENRLPIRSERKRQSKKIRKRKKLREIAFIAPYAHVENISEADVIPGSSFLDNISSKSQSVPTLLEQCLRIIYSKESDRRYTRLFPPGLAPLTGQFKGDLSVVSVQISWLHRMMAFAEQLLKQKDSQLIVKAKDDEAEGRGKMDKRERYRNMRTLWEPRTETWEGGHLVPNTLYSSGSSLDAQVVSSK